MDQTLPFLQGAPPAQSKNDQSESRRPQWAEVEDWTPPPPPMVPEHSSTPLKIPLGQNDIILILVGIVIGVVVMSMRPIIVNPMK